MSEEQYLLYRALDCRIGLVVETNNVALAQQRFYAARRKLQDPDLALLQFRRSPLRPDEEIWIVKGSAKEAAPGPEPNVA